jgi:hypothetical protein
MTVKEIWSQGGQLLRLFAFVAQCASGKRWWQFRFLIFAT